MATLPYSVGPNGQIIMTQTPTMITPSHQNMTGSPIDAAASKTLSGQALQIAAAKSLGAGQKGAGRRRKRRGGGGLDASIPTVPQANTINGVSFENNAIKAVNTLNQLRANSMYDGLQNAPPMQVKGGFRLSDAESIYPGSGTHVDTKRSRRTKKNGSRHKRTHRRISHKSSTRRSRRRRSHK
jgi:hypothetical protein